MMRARFLPNLSDSFPQKVELIIMPAERHGVESVRVRERESVLPMKTTVVSRACL